MSVLFPTALQAAGEDAFPLSLPAIPLARAPALALTGKTAEARSEELRNWFVERYGDRLPPETPVFRMLVRHLAETVVLDAKGRQRLHPQVWDDAFTAYARCLRVFEAVAGTPAPDAFKRYLARHAAETLLVLNGELDSEALVEAARALAPDSNVIRVAPGKLTAVVGNNWPPFRDSPALQRKIVLDRLCELNPNLYPLGYGTGDMEPGRGEDGLAVQQADGARRVFRYAIADPDAPLCLPPHSAWATISRGGRLDLRGLPHPDLRQAAAIAPEEIDLACCRRFDLATLRPLTSLRRLNLRGTGIADLAPLKGLALTHLDVSDTAVSDLSPLRGMPLQSLRLNNTPVSDLAPLAGMPLRRLSLRDTGVSDLAPLQSLPLEDLVLSRRRFENADAVNTIRSLDRVSDQQREQWFAALGSNLWHEPVPVSVGDPLRGRSLAVTFESERGRQVCDLLTMRFDFAADGALQRAHATKPPDLNVVHLFRPVRLSLEDGSLECFTLLRLPGGPNSGYAYTLSGALAKDKLSGDFRLVYEQEIMDPHGGYKVVVHDIRGRIEGAVTARAGDRQAPDALAPDRDWPAWRGPAGDGSADPDEHALVPALSSAQLAWISETPLPDSAAVDARKVIAKSKCNVSGGYAAPVIRDGRLFLYYYQPAGEAYDAKVTYYHAKLNGYGREKWTVEADDVVLCLDAGTGKLLWRRVFPRRALNFNAYNAGDPQPLLTPCAGDGSVYAVGTGGRVYALDARTGASLWETHLGQRWRCQQRTRRVCIRRERLPRFNHDFGSAPLLAGGVLVCTDHVRYIGGQTKQDNGLIGFDARGGARLWHAPGICDLTSVPLRWPHSGRDYLLAGGPDALRCLDPKDGRVLWTLPGAGFPIAPALSGDLLVCNSGDPPQLTAYRLAPGGATEAWRLDGAYALGLCPPAVVDGRLFLFCEVGLACIDLSAGRVLAAVETDPHPAGMIGLGDRVLIPGFQLARWTGELELIGPWPAPHAAGTSPAYVDGRLFFRGRDALFCYDLREASVDTDDIAKLLELLRSGNQAAERSALEALGTARGEAGLQTVRDELLRHAREGRTDAFRHLAWLLLDPKRRVFDGRPLLEPIVREIIEAPHPALLGWAVTELLNQAEDIKKAVAPLLFEYLGDARHVDAWQSIWRFLRLMGKGTEHHERIVEALAPHLISKNKRAREQALLLASSELRHIESQTLFDKIARGLFLTWTESEYANRDALDRLMKMGKRAAALEDEARKLIYHPRAAGAAQALIRSMHPGEKIEFGPKLDEKKPPSEDGDGPPEDDLGLEDLF